MSIIDKKGITNSGPLRRMARGICLKLRIPEDNSLSFVIGEGVETSNEPAVASWLADQGFQPDRTAFQNACEALQRTLAESCGDS